MKEIKDILIKDIKLSPYQTRKIKKKSEDIVEFASNISKVGLITPILVKPLIGDEEYSWQLLAGERRLTAFKFLYREVIPACIVTDEDNIDDIKQWLTSISENLMRKPLTVTETQEAIDIAKTSFNMKQNELSEVIGLTEQRLSQIQGVQKIPKDLTVALDNNRKLTKRHIDAFRMVIGDTELDTYIICEIDDNQRKIIKEKINELLNEILEKDLSGEDAVKLAKAIVGKKDKRQKKTPFSSLSNGLIIAIKACTKTMLPDKKELTIKQAKEMIQKLEKVIETLEE